MEPARTIIVGDIHGCLKELEALLQKCAYNERTDRLIFVGDLINKGPDPLGVLRKAKDLGVEVVLGNHELGFLQAKNRGTPHKLDSQLGQDLTYWRDYMASWPTYLEAENFIVVHAGIDPRLALDQTPVETLTKIRTWDGQGKDLQNPENPPWYEFYHGEKLIVFGHWARQGLLVRNNVIGLDSGCVYGKQLSAVILPERKIVQVDAEQTYASITGDGTPTA